VSLGIGDISYYQLIVKLIKEKFLNVNMKNSPILVTLLLAFLAACAKSPPQVIDLSKEASKTKQEVSWDYKTPVAVLDVTLYKEGGARLKDMDLTGTNSFSPDIRMEGEYFLCVYGKRDGKLSVYHCGYLPQPDFNVYSDPGGATPQDSTSILLQIPIRPDAKWFELLKVGKGEEGRGEVLLEGNLEGLVTQPTGSR
jgi:hypothetical protein